MARIPKRDQPPQAVRLIRAELAKLMATEDPEHPGEVIGSSVGVYAYFDYDYEPIYVGQTALAFRDRVGRHLTGQRSDAVAKFILDPFEVAYVSMWSIPAVATAPKGEKKAMLDPYEYTVYKMLEKQSQFGAVLNEGVIKRTDLVDLPKVVTGRIIPNELWEERGHSDIRIARRAATISRLSQMISEREVSGGMRRTLLLQAKRLAWLAERRIHDIGATVPDAEDAAISED